MKMEGKEEGNKKDSQHHTLYYHQVPQLCLLLVYIFRCHPSRSFMKLTIQSQKFFLKKTNPEIRYFGWRDNTHLGVQREGGGDLISSRLQDLLHYYSSPSTRGTRRNDLREYRPQVRFEPNHHISSRCSDIINEIPPTRGIIRRFDSR